MKNIIDFYLLYIFNIEQIITALDSSLYILKKVTRFKVNNINKASYTLSAMIASLFKMLI